MNSILFLSVLIILTLLCLILWFSRYRNRYSPDLPSVSQYGGNANLQGNLLATEYPADQQINTQHLSDSYSYVARPEWLESEHLQVFRILENMLLNTPYRVFPQVSLNMLLMVNDAISDAEQTAAIARLVDQKVDFALYHVQQQMPVLVILLETAAKTTSQQIRQHFLFDALQKTQIPLLRLSHEHCHDTGELRRQLKQSGLKITPQCPACHAPMAYTKTSSGQIWLACKRRQKGCKTVLPVDSKTLPDNHS